MAMGRSDGVQDELMATWAEMPRSPGHALYDRFQDLLGEASFAAFVAQMCKPYYAAKMGAPSLPPGRYFRASPSSRSVLALRRRRGAAIDAGSTTWLSTPSPSSRRCSQKPSSPASSMVTIGKESRVRA
jgi:hypothetical protein